MGLFHALFGTKSENENSNEQKSGKQDHRILLPKLQGCAALVVDERGRIVKTLYSFSSPRAVDISINASQTYAAVLFDNGQVKIYDLSDSVWAGINWLNHYDKVKSIKYCGDELFFVDIRGNRFVHKENGRNDRVY